MVRPSKNAGLIVETNVIRDSSKAAGADCWPLTQHEPDPKNPHALAGASGDLGQDDGAAGGPPRPLQLKFGEKLWMAGSLTPRARNNASQSALSPVHG
jgi:hypothetical protein